jgi:hypothetical protein
VNNLVPAVFNGMLGLGQLLAPTYGAMVNSAIGYQYTFDIVAIISLTFGLTYLWVGDGW